MATQWHSVFSPHRILGQYVLHTLKLRTTTQTKVTPVDPGDWLTWLSDVSGLQMMALESTLHQEQSMHAVTRAELASVKEDNERLRQQLKSTRNQLLNAAEPARLAPHHFELSTSNE